MEGNEQNSNNRMVLLLIAGIPVTVTLIATWLWYYVVQGELDLAAMLGTSNSGTLVQPPRQLDEVALREINGLPFQYSELEPKWTFLIPGGARCEAVCEKNLYTTRQIHIAMGQEFSRIRRIYLSDAAVSDTVLDVEHLSDDRPAPDGFIEYLASEHRGLRVLEIAPGEFEELLEEHRADPGSWYLVDPAGWIMMSYQSEVGYKGVMSDLTFLLKNSSE